MEVENNNFFENLSQIIKDVCISKNFTPDNEKELSNFLLDIIEQNYLQNIVVKNPSGKDIVLSENKLIDAFLKYHWDQLSFVERLCVVKISMNYLKKMYPELKIVKPSLEFYYEQ